MELYGLDILRSSTAAIDAFIINDSNNITFIQYNGVNELYDDITDNTVTLAPGGNTYVAGTGYRDVSGDTIIPTDTSLEAILSDTANTQLVDGIINSTYNNSVKTIANKVISDSIHHKTLLLN